MNPAISAFRRLAIAGVLAWAGQAGAALNEVFPADFMALPEGRGTTTFYLFDRRQDGPWAKDQQVGELHVDSTIGAVRFNRFYRLGGWKVSPILVVSGVGMTFSGRSVPPGVSRERSGLADLRVGGTVWLIDAPESRHYLGLNLMTVWQPPPPGKRDRQSGREPPPPFADAGVGQGIRRRFDPRFDAGAGLVWRQR